MSNEDFQFQFLGVSLDENDMQKYPRMDFTELAADLNLPENFSSAEKWPRCIHDIKNQLSCGSCWAFSGSEVLSDRYCIASGEKVNMVLSPQYMVSCDSGDGGCKGGQMNTLWDFLENTGTVEESCLTYHSGDGSDFPCSKFTKCEDGKQIKNYYAKKGATRAFQNVESIKAEIYTNGPVQTGFMVYEDFKAYTGGVYEFKSGKFLGGHAVKIIGWGTDNGQGHWIVANSWGPTWGEKGFFRIKHGQCKIEQFAMTGIADLGRI